MTTRAPYAAAWKNSRGRAHNEPAPAWRGEMQRDRDRIIHCAAFRRLEYKTQVFVNHEGDMFRTRLTHTLEVSQIARTVARAMHLNEDLTEAIALAHDLGHTPFGHAGQDVLNTCMRDYGGFEHNLQSLRVVDVLEEKYADFTGLNLTFETREGILKHCAKSKARELGGVGERFLNGTQPSLEAQLTNIADEIAYNNHDIDDGLRAGLLTVDQLQEVALFRRHYETVERTWPGLNRRRLTNELVRAMIGELVVDLIETSTLNIQAATPESIDDVRAQKHPLMSLSEPIRDEIIELKRFLRKNLYFHEQVLSKTDQASIILKALFESFINDEQLLPEEYREAIIGADQPATSRPRIVADYIAGMTDRYAIIEHERIIGPANFS